jgi:hypothetical protein
MQKIDPLLREKFTWALNELGKQKLSPKWDEVRDLLTGKLKCYLVVFLAIESERIFAYSEREAGAKALEMAKEKNRTVRRIVRDDSPQIEIFEAFKRIEEAYAKRSAA